MIETPILRGQIWGGQARVVGHQPETPPPALDDEVLWKDLDEKSRLSDDGCALVRLIAADIFESATPWEHITRTPAGHPLLAAGPSVVVAQSGGNS